MEESNIVYTGVTRATSDLDCPDGDLSLSHNLISQNGAIRPVVLPDEEFTMGEGEKLVYIHSTSGYKNYLYLSDGTLKAFKIEEGVRSDYDFAYTLGVGEAIRQIQSLGNTLMLMTNTSIRYVLYKGNNYKYLGDKMPELEMNFGLVGKKVESETIGLDDISAIQKFPSELIPNYIDDEQSTALYNALTGTINKMVSDEKDIGRFIHAFLVRYAYNTINGYTMHSSPVLMLPNTGRFPCIPCVAVVLPDFNDSDYIMVHEAKVSFYSAQLNYWADADVIASLADWKDIIQSVDIFVSEPITRFRDMPTGWSIRLASEVQYFDGAGSGYLSLDWSKFASTGMLHDQTEDELYPPMTSEEEFSDKVKNTSLFWKVKSIPVDELKEASAVQIDGSVLQNLGVQERLEDDYLSHDRLACGYSFVYNQRLNISNVRRTPYVPTVKSMVSYLNAPNQDSDIDTYDYRAIVFIRSDNGIVKAESEVSTLGDLLRWVYYPNPNAFRMVIERDKDGVKAWADLTLKEHTGLNGSYYYTDSYIQFSDAQPTLPAETENAINEPNKIYTSEVGNPFFFPIGGINTVGVGEIVGISSTTRALSQGQFGQFPLLVFATDGIWAMEVSDTGLYSTRQPISRDVCSNADSVTQIDGAVVFVSDKGIMLVDGSNVSLISAELDGPTFDPLSVERLQDILAREGMADELGEIGPVKDFFASCHIAYDYPNARLVFYQEDIPYAYVYSINARTWGTMTSGISNCVTDYPNSYLQMADRRVVNLCEKQDFDSNKKVKTLLLSRPLKLGDDALKTVNNVINRGFIKKTEGATVLFASHDGVKYIPIGSAVGYRLTRLQGSPYRYFRILCVREMDAGESLSMTSVYYTKKWRNKPR